MRVALAQIDVRLNRSNLEHVLEIVQNYHDRCDLIVFPELALNGYLLQDKLYEDAWQIEELEPLAKASQKVDIVVGAAIKEKKGFRNSALYFHDGVLFSRHDKLHLPNYGMFEEARYFEAGSEFESFLVSGIKISMLVCEDMWSAKMHEALFSEDPDLIITIAASPARGFGEDGLEIEKQWSHLLGAAALNSKSKVVFVNRVGFEDGLGFWGGSRVLDQKAKEIVVLPKFEEKIEIVEVDL